MRFPTEVRAMHISFTNNTWFDIESDENCTTIGTSTVDGDYVEIQIRNKRHLKDLVKKLNEVMGNSS